MPNISLMEHRVLILAPLGSDARSTAAVLAREGIETRVCESMDEFCKHTALGAGVLLLTEEALVSPASEQLADCLENQPAWSDLPVIVLTSAVEDSQTDLRLSPLKPVGNVSLLERPLRTATLTSTVQVALRSRRRQYEVREMLRQQILARHKEEQARREAERLNRIKEEFLTTLSHELRTPLTPLLGWTKLLLGGSLSPTASSRALTIIERNIKAQGQLIDDLLDISRIVTGKMRLNLCPIDINKVVEAAIDVIRPAVEAKRISLEVEIPREPVTMTGDFDRLQQVCWNLLTNAVKFTPQGGNIRVEVLRNDTDVKIVVCDNGIGISAEFLPRLFERFSQADSSFTRSYNGLGIGLSLVRSLAELHGGTVLGESGGSGCGATFTVTLPYKIELKSEAAAPLATRNSAPVPTAILGLSGVRVLIVDDEPDARELLTVVLTQSGAEVSAASSVVEALQQYHAHAPNILVSDLGMPGEDGFVLIRKLRALERKENRIPAIALTAYARDEDRTRCLTSGFQRHIAKPIDPNSLVSAVAELVQDGHVALGS
jgi:signal transduction histidine kinase/ActR/RegA family two-component response regulator